MKSDSLPATCAEAVDNLYALLDQELTNDVRERVQLHFDNCPHCFPLYRFERAFNRFLKARNAAIAVPPKLQRRVFETIITGTSSAEDVL